METSWERISFAFRIWNEASSEKEILVCSERIPENICFLSALLLSIIQNSILICEAFNLIIEQLKGEKALI